MKTRTVREGVAASIASIRKHRRPWAWALLFVFVNLMAGCNYYKVVQSTNMTSDLLAQARADKYFILHEDDQAWHIRNLSLDSLQTQLTGWVEPVSEEHEKHLNPNRMRTNFYNPSEGDPLTEVHLYVTRHGTVEGYPESYVSIPLTNLWKVEIYESDRKASNAAWIIPVAIVGVLAIITIIVLLTKSSCPFVYIADGDDYRFVGEMYGGAIRPGLERDDYMPLPGFKPWEGNYRLKISNELKERQYTNLADLMVIDHPIGTKVLIDEYGRSHTIAQPQAPKHVLSDNMTDYRQVISTADSSWMMFNDDPAADRDMSSLTMTFDRPADAKAGKLVLHAKNSLWLDYVFGKFTEQFGTYYPTYQEKQRMIPPGEKATWARDQGLSLSVYLREGKQWTYVDDFPMVGPLASRDLVMPIDLQHVKGDDVTLRLTCGFMFWEVDYASMDFTVDEPVKVTELSPATAVDERGEDVRDELMKVDDRYLEQPNVGNEAIITYVAPKSDPGMDRSVFLHTRGYYEYIRDYTNEPNLGYLRTFKKQGAFTKFSRERYVEQLAREDLWASQNSQPHEK